MFVGDYLRKLRTRKGLSILRLSREAGLDPETIRRCEVNGRISERSAERLAAALGCPVARLRRQEERS